MKELIEYRMSMMDRLAAAAREFRTECLAVKDPFQPLEAGGWNVLEIATHTRDVDRLVYGARARRTAEEDNPDFQNFNGEQHMAANYSAYMPLEEILNQLVDQVESLVQMLRELPGEAWARISSHEMLGHGLTLQSWVEKDLAHIEEHLETVRRWNQQTH